MKRNRQTVLGVHAPTPRPTAFAALCVALVLSVPVASVLWLIEWLI